MNKTFLNPRRLRIAVIALLALVGLCALGLGLAFRQPPTGVQASIIGLTVTPPPDAAYAQVTGPTELRFPQDFGPRPDFRTEWWYYTGNLETSAGRHFGFQLTFFRRSVQPPAAVTPRPSDWAANQIYMAHFTLTDASAQQFHYFERFERGAAGLAGAEVNPNGDPVFQVWLNDWSVRQTAPGQYQLHVQEQGIVLDLTLLDSKGPILQGDQGYSQKGPQPGNASLYFSQTHLESRGTVSVGGQAYPVSGLSWMDREISTSALSQGEVGWDWFALQLDDGSELMAYVLRRSDGTISEFSSGSWISPAGEVRHLGRADFQVSAQSTWRSPHSGATYPASWKVRVPSLELELDVAPLLADQELNVSFIYWEGAVKFSGTRAGKPLAGFGYVELTGYAKSMQGQL
jgi:predicted secreted hydrolase